MPHLFFGCKRGAVISIAFFLCALPWLFFQLRYAVGGDVAFLSMAAQHVLAGERMIDAYFDNNPPMSYLIYIPAVLLSKTGIPLWYSDNIYIFFILGASLALTAIYLRAWPKLDPAFYWSFLAGYFVSQTVMAQHMFGMKDNLLAMVLVPFLLAQFLRTLYQTSSWSQRAVFLMGVPFILLKPQYMLLPAALLIHRVVKEKRWTIVFDFDFLTVAGWVIAYGLIIAFRFPDFLEEALKPIVVLYTSSIGPDFFPEMWLLLFSFGAIFLLACAGTRENISARYVVLFLSGLYALALFGFVIQGKGVAVHLLPLTVFLFPGIFLTALLYIPTYIDRYQLSFATVLGIFCLGYHSFLPDTTYPTHESIKNTFWARYIHEHAGKPGDSFYIEERSPEVVNPLALYMGVPLASRFSCLWFLHGMERMAKEGTPARERDYWRGIFSRYMAQDISRFKPAFVALPKNVAPEADVLKIFKTEPSFRREWSHYQKKGVGQTSYKSHIVLYDIYHRTQ